jgi:HrpA-like RNA helicase
MAFFSKLPIHAHESAIMDMIEANPLCIVVASTGSGKTLALPVCVARNHPQRVVVAIPTTVAVRSAHKTIQSNTDLSVGYAAGREVRYDSSTQLIYATTGHITSKLQYLYSKYPNDQIKQIAWDFLGGYVFIDEVHTGTCETTLLMGLMKNLFYTNGVYDGPKLIFATATFNPTEITKIFGECPMYSVDVFTHDVEIVYTADEFHPIVNDVDERIYTILNANHNINGHVMIFRPGINEVETTFEFLLKKYPAHPRFVFYRAYSYLSQEELDSIFDETPGKIKVIIGTNIMESSVTVKDVKIVIDTMTAKVAGTSTVGGDKLSLALISQGEATQRKGRTGRTCSGKVFRLCTEFFFNKLPTHKDRDIDKVPIYNIILKLIKLRLNSCDILHIDKGRFYQAVQTLRKLGAIEGNDEPYTVTEVGDFIAGIPLSIYNAYIVYLAYLKYLRDQDQVSLRTSIAIACMIEVYGPDFFYSPRRKPGEDNFTYMNRLMDHREQYHEKYRGDTDVHTFTNIYWDMQEYITFAAHKHGFFSAVKRFSNQNQMNNKKLVELLRVVKDIEELIGSKLQIWLDNIPQEDEYLTLGTASAKLFAQAYAMNRFQINETNNKVMYKSSEGVSYLINQRSSFTKIHFGTIVDSPKEIIAGQILEIQTKARTLHTCGIIVSDAYF